jgi:hypothetical protein
MNRVIAEGVGVQQQRQLSGAIAATALRTNYLVSFPVAMGFAGLSIDVDEDLQSIVANNGDENRVREYLSRSGIHASYSEGRGFEGMLEAPAGSTVHVFEKAASEGIPFQAVSAANVDQALASIDASSSVKSEVRRAAAAGQVVSIPRRPVKIGDFLGTGYTIEDPDTGAAAFRLSNGTNGGSAHDHVMASVEQNLTAMFDNINMLKTWTAKSGNGLTLQGDELFTPSEPDGVQCNVNTNDQETFVKIAIAAMFAHQILSGFKVGGADGLIDWTATAKGMVQDFLMDYLEGMFPEHNPQVLSPVEMARIGQLYSFLYAQSRELAFNCIPLG